MQGKSRLKWLLISGIILIIVIIIALAIVNITTLSSPLNAAWMSWAAIISGVVAFLAAIVQITGLDLYTLLHLKTSQNGSGNLKDKAVPDELSIHSTSIENLPPKPFNRLIGREILISELLGVLRNPEGQAILYIKGLGGMGKTALAYEIAERAMQERLFINLSWFSAKQNIFIGRQTKNIGKGLSTYNEVIRFICDQLFEEGKSPKHNQELVLRKLLQSKPFLLVLDNLDSLNEKDNKQLIEFLVSSCYPSRIILTSRDLLDPIEQSYLVQMRGLDELHSIELIYDEANQKGISLLVSGNKQIVHSIAKETGGMPLAIKLVVGEILAGLGVESILKRLQNALDEEQLYRFIYFDLWNTLTESSRETLVTVPAFAASVNRKMLQQASGLNNTEFDQAIMELVQKSLIDVSENLSVEKRRYSIHPVTRNFIMSDLPTLFERQSNK